MHEVQLTRVMVAVKGVLAGVMKMILKEGIGLVVNHHMTARFVLNFYRVSIVERIRCGGVIGEDNITQRCGNGLFNINGGLTCSRLA